MSSRWFVVGLLTVLIVSSCSRSDLAGIEGFEVATITINDVAMKVAVADTPDKREQGLMGVTELGGLDGMLFVFETETETGFWMKDTLIPLDIAFFDEAGVFVDGLTMEPCTEDPCPVYRSSGSYRYALETPEGELAFVNERSMLELAR